MADNINLIDIEDKTVKKDSVLSSNQIKTRATSFRSIKSNWDRYRMLSLSKQKLEKQLEETKSQYEEEKMVSGDDSIASKALSDKIAKIEERISILSRDDVPTKREQSRSIKLRGNMMNELVQSSSDIYKQKDAPVVENSNGGFYEGDISAAIDTSTPDLDVEKIANENDSAISTEVDAAMGNSDDVISRDDIKSVIEDNFAKIDEEVKPVAPVEPIVSTDDVNISIDNGSSEDTFVPIDDNEENTMSSENNLVVEPVIENPVVDNNIPVVSREEIEAEINGKLNETNEATKISRNNAASARTNYFDENGYAVQNPYVPMSDEAVEAARANIGYDEYEKKYADDWQAKADQGLTRREETVEKAYEVKPLANVDQFDMPREDSNVRDDIVIAPDRDEAVSYQVTQDEDLHFDYSDATEKDIATASKIETTYGGLEALKARALKLKEKNKQSKDYLDDAIREQNEEAQKASEIRSRAEEKEQAYRASLDKLNAYCEALEEDTRINERRAEEAKNEVESNRKFISDKENAIADFDRMMSEIDSCIGPEAVNVRVR